MKHLLLWLIVRINNHLKNEPLSYVLMICTYYCKLKYNSADDTKAWLNVKLVNAVQQLLKATFPQVNPLRMVVPYMRHAKMEFDTCEQSCYNSIILNLMNLKPAFYSL